MHTDPTQTTSQTPRPSFVIRSGTSTEGTRSSSQIIYDGGIDALNVWESHLKKTTLTYLWLVLVIVGLCICLMAGCTNTPDTVDGLPPAQAEEVPVSMKFEVPADLLYDDRVDPMRRFWLWINAPDPDDLRWPRA